MLVEIGGMGLGITCDQTGNIDIKWCLEADVFEPVQRQYHRAVTLCTVRSRDITVTGMPRFGVLDVPVKGDLC